MEKEVTDAWLEKHIMKCVKKLEDMLPKFEGHFPSACTTNMHYRVKNNDDWTNGFWTGLLWQAYEITGNSLFENEAKQQLKSFRKRLDQNYILNHHDIGFLYSLSAYAGYRIEKSEEYSQLVIDAAQLLMGRFTKKGRFIQAWGDLDDPKEYRLIIDSLLNLPLLFEATELSGDQAYSQIGKQHYHNVVNNIIRKDYSTYHTFYFNRQDGTPLKGATHQGFSDESCWARGQAWILLGMPLYHRFFKIEDESNIYKRLLEYYEAHLPNDNIPYWDLIFSEKDGEPRDSSAAAIVACGLIEAQKQGMINDGVDKAQKIIYQLGEHYETKQGEEGLLQHGVYAYGENKGVDEANLWGDYFYLEALLRLSNPTWKTYW